MTSSTLPPRLLYIIKHSTKGYPPCPSDWTYTWAGGGGRAEFSHDAPPPAPSVDARPRASCLIFLLEVSPLSPATRQQRPRSASTPFQAALPPSQDHRPRTLFDFCSHDSIDARSVGSAKIKENQHPKHLISSDAELAELTTLC